MIRIATDAVFPPFHYVDPHSPEGVTGYDVELARLCVRRAGYQPRVVRVDEYAQLFAGLLDGEFEMLAATTGITPQRQQRFLFSDPYFTTCQAVMVRAGEGSGREPGSIRDLRGVRIACSLGGTSEAAARAVGAGEIIPLAGERGGVEALLARQADAYIADEFAIVTQAAGEKRVRILAEPAALEHYGFGFAPGSAALRDKINRALRELDRKGAIESLRRQFKLNRPHDWPVRFEPVLRAVAPAAPSG